MSTICRNTMSYGLCKQQILCLTVFNNETSAAKVTILLMFMGAMMISIFCNKLDGSVFTSPCTALRESMDLRILCFVLFMVNNSPIIHLHPIHKEVSDLDVLVHLYSCRQEEVESYFLPLRFSITGIMTLANQVQN